MDRTKEFEIEIAIDALCYLLLKHKRKPSFLLLKKRRKDRKKLLRRLIGMGSISDIYIENPKDEKHFQDLIGFLYDRLK